MMKMRRRRRTLTTTTAAASTAAIQRHIQWILTVGRAKHRAHRLIVRRRWWLVTRRHWARERFVGVLLFFAKILERDPKAAISGIFSIKQAIHYFSLSFFLSSFIYFYRFCKLHREFPMLVRDFSSTRPNNMLSQIDSKLLDWNYFLF